MRRPPAQQAVDQQQKLQGGFERDAEVLASLNHPTSRGSTGVEQGVRVMKLGHSELEFGDGEVGGKRATRGCIWRTHARFRFW